MKPVEDRTIKTGDALLDRRIEFAINEAAKLLTGYSWRKKTILTYVFRSVIGYRIAEYLNSEEQRKRYAQRVDRLYALFPRVGLDEEKVAEMSRRVISKMAV